MEHPEAAQALLAFPMRTRAAHRDWLDAGSPGSRPIFRDARPLRPPRRFRPPLGLRQNVDFVGAQGRRVERHPSALAALVAGLPLALVHPFGFLA